MHAFEFWPDPQTTCPEVELDSRFQYNILGEHYHFDPDVQLGYLDQMFTCRAMGGKLPEARTEGQFDALSMLSCKNLLLSHK